MRIRTLAWSNSILFFSSFIPDVLEHYSIKSVEPLKKKVGFFLKAILPYSKAILAKEIFLIKIWTNSTGDKNFTKVHHPSFLKRLCTFFSQAVFINEISLVNFFNILKSPRFCFYCNSQITKIWGVKLICNCRHWSFVFLNFTNKIRSVLP